MFDHIDIVIVNYRTPDDLHNCLESLITHRPMLSWTVHIANVDPLDQDVAVAEAFHKTIPRSRYLEFDSNVGYAKAVNFALGEGSDSSHDKIGIFNADVKFTSNVIDSACSLFSNRRVGVVGPRQVGDNNQITHAGIVGTHQQPKLRGWKEQDTGQYTDIEPVVSVSGSAYFTTTALWWNLWNCPIYREIAPEAFGAFLPTPHYYEETWYSYHAHAHGMEVMYDGTHTMYHRWHKASPLGGEADRHFMPISRKMFRDACDRHNILHD